MSTAHCPQSAAKTWYVIPFFPTPICSYPIAMLQSQVLRADALKFLTTFRIQILKADVLAVFPGVVRLLGSESNVVHSQAAMCIESLLSLKVRFAVAVRVRKH